MADLFNDIKREQTRMNNRILTQNGAVAFSTTNNALIDMLLHSL